MSFLNNLVEQFTHQGGQSQQQGGYSQQSYQQTTYSSGPNQGPPQPPAPWFAEWDNYQNTWVFINRETGERTHQFPSGYGQESRGYGGYQQQGYQQGYGQAPPPEQQKSHSGRNMALAAGAGLAGGALLMHEGHKVEEHWDEDKYRMEQNFDDARDRVDYDVDRADNYVDQKVYDGVQDVEDFPENAARWTGEKVQEVEDIPEDIDRRWDNFKQDVEDVPEDIAYGVGDAVGDVERFGDNMDNAYDAGRDEQRYDDDRW